MADRSDLWGPAVRKWMTEWHSPVSGMMSRKRSFRGSGPQQILARHSALLLQAGAGYLLLEPSIAPSHLLLEPVS